MIIKNNDISEEKIKEWIKKWGYLYYYYLGPLPSVREVKKMINKLKREYNIKKRIKEIETYKEKIKKEKIKIITNKKLTKKEVFLTKIISFLMFYKLYRKELLQKSYVVMDNFFKEIKRRTKYSINQLKYLTFSEFRDLILNNKNYLKEIKKRKEEQLIISYNNKQIVITNKRDIKKIYQILRIYNPSNTKSNFLVAYSSKPVTGRLIFINSKGDMKKIKNIKEPFILGSFSTHPDLLPAMVKAAGIITKIGGMTSHAAVVSRELKKPCIVGYEKLFDEFKEGDIILLDTEHGKIKKIESRSK